MTARSVPEWIGASPDTTVPSRVKLRVFYRFDGICPKCSRRMRPGHWDTDHVIALTNGGENRERNLQPLCDSPCHTAKTREDVAEKSRTYLRQKSHVGVKEAKRHRWGYGKDDQYRKKVSGELVMRETRVR